MRFDVRVVLLLPLLLLSCAHRARHEGVALRMRWDTSEVDAALAVLAKGDASTEEDWQRLFQSGCFLRLERREESLGKALGTPRTVDKQAFRTLLTDSAFREKHASLEATLKAWRQADLEALSRRVQAFLPPGSPQTFTLCPMIKPQDNTFVFDLGGRDPSIILYLDPGMSQGEFESTIAHEAHHVGLGGYENPAEKALLATQPQEVQDASRWMGAFGEGLAMLAAAGSADVHPHASSEPEVRARWDQDMARFAQNLRVLEAFFLEVLEGRLTGAAQRQKAFEFYGPEQGPWYTVGYQMAVLVERQLGRERLLRCMAEPRSFLAAYEEAARKDGGDWPHWSPVLLERLAFR